MLYLEKVRDRNRGNVRIGFGIHIDPEPVVK